MWSARSGAMLCGVLLVALAGPAQALPVVFEWEETLPAMGGSNIPGVDPGDLITIRVFADNGGADLLSQTWNNADLTRATLTVGSYSATYFPPTSFADPVFQSDAVGTVSQARLVFVAPHNPANFDSAGGGGLPSLARNGANGSAGGFVSWNSTDGDTFAADQWTLALVPEPSGLLLLGLTALALTLARSRPGSASRQGGRLD